MSEDIAFTDSAGAKRIGNRWGFNSFVTVEDAERALPSSRPKGSTRRLRTWYIWRLADGTYDFSACPEPKLPGHPAELIKTVER